MHIKKHGIFYLLFFLLYSVTAQENSITILHTNEAYIESLQSTYKTISIEESRYASALRDFKSGITVSAFETEAIPLVQANKNYTFYPHYVQTVVIAIDRDQTSERIIGWTDILQSSLPINFSFGDAIGHMVWNTPQNFHIVTTMAKALYGSYDIHAIAKDFKNLYIAERFFSNDNTKAISVMYDSEAVSLIQEGRNIEIVFPKEGTQIFVAGLLCNMSLDFSPSSLNKVLIENGFRLPDGRANKYYPPKESYTNSYRIQDYTEYNAAIARIDGIMRRESFNTKRYGFANNKERSIGYIVCIIVVILYLFSTVFRLTQKNIKAATIAICLLELLLATTQYIKAITSGNPLMETILWYAFYLPFTMIPVLFVYIAIITGKGEDKIKPPSVFSYYAFASFMCFLFVATNNLHEQIFIIHDYIHTYFDYNWGYFLVMAWIYASLAYAIIVLIYKSFKTPRKWAFALPLLASTLTLLYTIGVILRIPIARDFEVGYGTGIALLLFIEACIQSRLFPINKGYKKLFSHSSLHMQIEDIYGNTVLQSSKCNTNSHYVLKKKTIAGGTFLYYEDHTTLNATKEKLAKNIRKLEKNNEVLKTKAKTEATLASLSAQKEVYKNIDIVLERDTKKISTLLENMKENENTKKIITTITIIACGIKRDCILRINTLYKQSQSVYDFLNYIHEMSEFAKHLPLNITIGSELTGELPVHHTVCMYEIFRIIIEGATEKECADILVQLYKNKANTIFSITTDKDISPWIDFQSIKTNVIKESGIFSIKPLDDTTSYLLAFANGESSS